MREFTVTLKARLSTHSDLSPTSALRLADVLAERMRAINEAGSLDKVFAVKISPAEPDDRA